MNKPLCSLLLVLFFWNNIFAQVNVASWTFDDLDDDSDVPLVIPANLGQQQNDAAIYLDGRNGSDEWLQSELESYNSGTTLNDPRTPHVASRDFSLENNSANGKSIVFKFSMAGLKDPVLTFATRGTASGFTSQKWYWSTDSITYTEVDANTADNSVSYVTKQLELSSVDELDNADTVYLKLTVDGATSWRGNNRFDNIVISATDLPPIYAAGYPKLADISSSGFDILTSLNEPGKCYYVLLPADASEPSPAEVKAGTGRSDTIPVAKGTINVSSADTTYSVAISSLSSGSSYHVFLVSEDTAATPNLQETVTKLAVATLPADQTITFSALADKTYGDMNFILNASSTSALPVSFSSSDTSIAKIIGNEVQILKAGTVAITASQEGNENYNPAEIVSRTLKINKANQSITFSALPDKTYGDANFTLNASSTSGLPVSFSSSDTLVVKIAGNEVQILKAGTVTITASQEGNENYNPAEAVSQTLVINKADQTITFSALPDKTYGDSNFTLNANSTSGLPVSFSSSDTLVAKIAGNEVQILKTGTVTITASQEGNANYNSAEAVSQTLTIKKEDQSITFSALADKTYGDANFTLNASSTFGLSVSFSSSDTSIAKIAGNEVQILKTGTVTITASQEGNENYNSAEAVSQTLKIKKEDQSITFSALADKIYGDTNFTLNASSTFGLPISFSSSDTSIAKIAGNEVQILKAGTVTITASQEGNENYNPAETVSQTLVINKADQTITFSALPDKTYDDTNFTLNASSTFGLPVSFSSSDTLVAKIVDNAVQILKAGTVTITASQEGNANYNSAEAVFQTLVINKADQTITFSALADKIYGDTNFTLNASSTFGLPISFSSSDTLVAKIVDNEVQIRKAGTVTITASQEGNANYNPAEAASQTLVINKADQTITFSALPNRTYGDSNCTLIASSTSGLPVSFSSSDTLVAKIGDNEVQIRKAGTVTITASQEGNANYNSAEAVFQTLVINKADQTITFSALADKTYGNATFTLNAATNSDLPLSFSSSDTSIAKITGNEVQIRKAGTIIITASQEGNENYNSAESVSQTLTINKANQSITFSALPNKTYGDANFTLSTVTNSGLPLNFSSSDTSIAKITGNEVHILKAGTVMITASQEGNTNYNPAEPVFQTLTINKANQSITFSSLPDKTYGDANFPLNARSTAGLPVSFSSSDVSIAEIIGNEVQILKAGAVTITALQQGNENYNPAPNVMQTLTIWPVNKPPVIDAIPDQTICYTSAGQTLMISGISAAETEQLVTLSVSSNNQSLFKNLNILPKANGRAEIRYTLNDNAGGIATITVKAKDNGGIERGGVDTCVRSFQLIVHPLPAINIYSDKGSTISKGEEVHLSATGGMIYEWTGSGGIVSEQNGETLTIRPAQTTTYRVVAKDSCGCTSDNEFTVTVKDDYALNANNILTPDGDGVNDKLEIKNIDMYPDNTIQIYDRAGRLLYREKSYSNNWDGTLNGIPLSEGTYFYIVDFGPKLGKMKGFISLVRNR